MGHATADDDGAGDADPTAEAVQAASRGSPPPSARRARPDSSRPGPDKYGEGDVFIGVTVPDTRTVVARFAALPQHEVARLLESPVHEHRLAALLVMVRQFEVARRPRTRDDAAGSHCTRHTSRRCGPAA